MYRRVMDDPEWTRLNSNGLLDLDQNYLDRNVKLGASYTYRIGAAVANDSEQFSSERSVTIKCLFRELSVAALDAGVELKWAVESIDSVRRFDIVRRDSQNTRFMLVPNGNMLNPSTSRFLDKTAKPKHTYEYKVLVLLEGYDSVESAVIKVAAPGAVALAQNVPNPFNPATTIAFNLPEDMHARLDIYDVKGRLVRTLLDETRPAGYNEAEWDGLNQSGDPAASGVYFCRLEIPGQVVTRKMALVK